MFEYFWKVNPLDVNVHEWMVLENDEEIANMCPFLYVKILGIEKRKKIFKNFQVIFRHNIYTQILTVVDLMELSVTKLEQLQ